MTRLLLIRHGQSVANKERFFAGQIDCALTELGRKQAKKTAEFIYENYSVDVIYSSGLERAFNTALPLANAFGLEIICDENLREINAGSWEKTPFEILEKLYAKDFSVWQTNIGLSRPTGGESVKEMGERFLKQVLEIAKQNETKTVVISTHATPIRVLECLLSGLTLDKMHTVPWVSNASVSELVFDGGELKIVKMGQDGHLENLRSVLPANV